jgi:cystathionine gamma-synthase
MSRREEFDTIAVHGGAGRHNALDAITTPIAQTTTYRFASIAELREFAAGNIKRPEYSRYTNPTVAAAESRVAALEGAAECAMFASGMGALTTTLLALTEQGRHVVLTDDCYRPSEQFIRNTLARYGVDATVVPTHDAEALAAAVVPGRTRVIFTELPTNPHVRVPDIAAIAAVRDRFRGVRLVVDSTFATPFNCRPLELGADLVVHSATKFISGHNDVLAGAVCGKAGPVGVVRDLRNQLGPTLDPHAAYLVLRGMKTLGLRMERHNRTAQAIAEFLEKSEQIERVWYPGLASHPDHEVARRTMRGFGGVVTFLLKGGADAAERLCDACRVVQIGASLGGCESLLHPPALFSYSELPREEREKLGMFDGLIRLAVGLEDERDLIADLERALAAAQGAA